MRFVRNRRDVAVRCSWGYLRGGLVDVGGLIGGSLRGTRMCLLGMRVGFGVPRFRSDGMNVESLGWDSLKVFKGGRTVLGQFRAYVRNEG